LQDAHARGMAIQFNYFLDKEAFKENPDGTYSVDLSKMKDAVNSLDREFLTIEATGDYNGAKKMLTELSVIRPHTQKTLDRLKSLPTDIEPVFVTAEKVLSSQTPAHRKGK